MDEVKTIMWIAETDRYGMTDRKFIVEDPIHIPRVGDIIDDVAASGIVEHVHWSYPKSHYKEVIYVFLKDKS